VTTDFDTDTAARELGGGVFAVRIERRWWVVNGPNGGYVAACIVRAMRAALGSDERALRSLTVHYTAPPVEGEAQVAVAVERAGRNLSTLSARLTQDGRLLALALAAFSGDYEGAATYEDARPPEVPAPEEIAVGEGRGDFEPPPFARNFDIRRAIGPMPFAGGGEAVTGGWIAPLEARPLDEALIVALADAWWPAPFGVVDRPVLAPTIDLTVHVRAPLPRDHDFVLVDVRSRVAREGFFDEDANIFSRDGVLLAQARQLALLL